MKKDKDKYWTHPYSHTRDSLSKPYWDTWLVQFCFNMCYINPYLAYLHCDHDDGPHQCDLAHGHDNGCDHGDCGHGYCYHGNCRHVSVHAWRQKCLPSSPQVLRQTQPGQRTQAENTNRFHSQLNTGFKWLPFLFPCKVLTFLHLHLQSQQIKHTTRDCVNESIIIWKMNPLVLVATSLKFKSAFLNA